MVQTSQKSFQSMLMSLACLACCSFLPLACCCLVLWQSKTVLHRVRMLSLSFRYNTKRSISSLLISRMLVYPFTKLLKYSLFLELVLRNQKCGLFFSRQLRATKKFLPFLAAYCAVCCMMACSPSESFYGSSAMYFGGSGSLSQVKICSRKMFCLCSSSMAGLASISASIIWILASSSWGDSRGISSSFMPCSSFLLTYATWWSQQARQGLSCLRKANSCLCCSRCMSIFSNSEPLWATCSAVFSSNSESTKGYS